MLEARTVSISIERPWRDLYEAVWLPECFQKWASGLSGSSLEKDGEAWKAEGPEGPVRIRFTDHNAFGVVGHHVHAGSGSEIHVPMRGVPNGDGAEVLLTLFRQPGCRTRSSWPTSSGCGAICPRCGTWPQADHRRGLSGAHPKRRSLVGR